MGKLIAAMNMTIDGFCDHTAMIADDEIHRHYTDLISDADSILYGRITFQLMEYWVPIVENPTGIKAMDEFAIAIDKIRKIVFSNTLKNVDWKTARLAKRGLKEEALELKQSGNADGKNILVGRPGLIVALANLNLIDEFQLCIHPIILAKGSTVFFKNISERIDLKLIKTKVFGSGAIMLYYQPTKNS